MKAVTVAHTTMLVAATAVAAREVDDIRGPKPPVEVPVPGAATPWWIHALLGLLVVAAVGALVWRLRRRTGEVPSAEQTARRELDRLGRDGATMPAGDFAEAASGILRRFIERRFGVAAPRRTTEEFLHEVLEGPHGLEERLEALRGFLRSCDLAKFAGEELDPLQREDLLVRARGFINEPPKQREEAA